MPTTRTWRPIADGELGQRVRDALDGLADDLCRHRDAAISDLWQLSDRALFFTYLGACRDSALYRDLASEYAQQVVERLQRDDGLPAAIFSGWLATAWTLEHLQRVFPGDNRALDEARAELARRAHDLLATKEWTEPFDLFKGLIGFGVHAMERRKAGEDDLRRVIDHLADLAEYDEDEQFASWWRPPEHCGGPKSWPDGQYNLGLAHGTPGAVALLAATVRVGLAGDDGRKLLHKAVAWLLDLGGQFGVSGFPAMLAPNKPFFRSDASWAYGDAGVAMAILNAGRSLGDSHIERAALDIARRSLRRPLNDYLGPPRPAISHGAAGLTQIYSRLYQATSDPAFLQAAQTWCRRLLDHRRDPSDETTCFPEIHNQLFGGQVGIGLVLLAASEELEPQWDRLLLLSM